MALCDYAGIDGAGKLNIIGMFGRFNFPKVPTTYPRFYIVLQMRAAPEDIGKAPNVAVSVLDPHGTLVFPEQPIQLAAVPTPTEQDGTITFNLALEVNGTVFTQYGMHNVSVKIDGRRAGKLAFGVRPPDGVPPVEQI